MAILGNGRALTGKGYDDAMDELESGLKLDLEDIVHILEAIPEMKEVANGETPEGAMTFHEMIWYMQEVGFEKFKEEVKKVKNQVVVDDTYKEVSDCCHASRTSLELWYTS